MATETPVQNLKTPNNSPMAKYIQNNSSLPKPEWKFKKNTEVLDFKWEVIKELATPQQKAVFAQIRNNLIDKIQAIVNNTPGFTFYRYGSTSLDSDVDITIIPNLVNLNNPQLSKVYTEILDYYHKKFGPSMNDMFNMNIYACPFFYVTDLNYTLNVNMHEFTLTEEIERVSSGSKPCVFRCSTSRALRSPNCASNNSTNSRSSNSSRTSRSTPSRSSTKRPSNTDLPLDTCKSMFCLEVDDETIKQVQFPYITYYLADQPKLLAFLDRKISKTEDQIKLCVTKSLQNPDNPYTTLIGEYEKIMFANPDSTPTQGAKDENTKQALHILTKATFFMEDAYHTQGAVLHVTCPEEYKTLCFNKIAHNNFLCSVYENLGYAYHYIQQQQKKKAIKYIERYTEALMIYIIRISGRELIKPEVYESLLYYPLPPNAPKTMICNHIQTYSQIYKLYTLAKDLNCKRKNNQDITSELNDIPEDVCSHVVKWLTDITPLNI